MAHGSSSLAWINPPALIASNPTSVTKPSTVFFSFDAGGGKHQQEETSADLPPFS